MIKNIYFINTIQQFDIPWSKQRKKTLWTFRRINQNRDICLFYHNTFIDYI